MHKVQDQRAAMLLKSIGKKVNHHREQHNLTHREFAIQLGMPVKRLKQIESGDIDIGLSDLVTIAKELSITWEMLLS